MKLLSCLSFDQIGHTPGRPQAGAITQDLGTFFQALTQLVQLRRQQARFAAGSPSLKKRLGSLFFPGLVPTTDRLPVNPQFPGHFPLTEAAVKQLGSSESPPFQIVEVSFNAFWVAHAQRLP